jgi:hypothetical protein
MANIVNANPFGSYVQGQQQGTENAIRTGMAARDFRNNDLAYDYMKWYNAAPRREDAMLDIATKQADLFPKLSEQRANMAAATGSPQLWQQEMDRENGSPLDWSNFNALPPQQQRRNMALYSGQEPAAFANPMVTNTGKYGTQRQALDEYGRPLSTSGAMPGANDPNYDLKVRAERMGLLQSLGEIPGPGSVIPHPLGSGYGQSAQSAQPSNGASGVGGSSTNYGGSGGVNSHAGLTPGDVSQWSGNMGQGGNNYPNSRGSSMPGSGNVFAPPQSSSAGGSGLADYGLGVQ